MTAIDPSYQLLACQYLRDQLDALAREIRGIRKNEDIEPVHRARVASRRMRAAMRMFEDCFSSKPFDKWRKRVRNLTKGLGAARDLDVQIEFVETFLEGLDRKDRKHRPGINRLLLRLRQHRDAVQPRVLKTVDALEEDYALAEMHGELAKILFTLRGRDVKVQSPFVFQQAAAHIGARKHDLLANEETLADAEDVKGHHRLRIAAKRLRYTMEMCDPVYGGQLGSPIKAVKRLQSLLGDIHDCDVWAENIQVFMDGERLRATNYYGHPRPFNRLKPGLLMLLDERKLHREQTFAALLAYWERITGDQIWEDLDTLLQSHAAALRAPEAKRESENQPADATDEEVNESSPGQ